MKHILAKTQDTKHKTQDVRCKTPSFESWSSHSLRSLIAALSVLLLIVFPTHADEDRDEEVRDEVVGLFGTILTPSIFSTGSSERLSASLYGRTLTGEGDVPDFDWTPPKNAINEMAIFASGRMGGLGLTLGFGQESEFEFSQPFILSVDYKKGLMEETPMLNAAADVQYSMIVLPDEENIGVSALGFGVFSINGIVSANLLMLEPYAGLTLNYVYLNSEEEEFIGVWKIIPKLGLQVDVFPMVRVGTEIKFINNEHLDSAWMWDLGVNVRF